MPLPLGKEYRKHGLIPKQKEQQSHDVSPTVELLVDDIDKFCDELKAKDVKFVKELHDETWGAKQAAFSDPDGNILEVTQIDWQKYFEVSAKGASKDEKS